MKRSSFIGTAVITMIGLGFVLAMPIGTASASKQALVKVEYKARFFGFKTSVPTPYYGRTSSPGFEFGTRQGYSVAEVSTAAPTGTIMWPGTNIKCTNNGGTPGTITGCTASSFTYSGFLTVFASKHATWMAGPGQIGPSHAGAAASPSQLIAIPDGVITTTTKCFKSILSVSGGTPLAAQPNITANGSPNGLGPIPNQCFPRNGAGKRTPGGKKFGGTARMLLRLNTFGTLITGGGGSSQFSVRPARTPALNASPDITTNTGVVGTIYQTNITSPIPEQRFVMSSIPPLTTGAVTVAGTQYNTQQTVTGSHNLNATNLTGMISMVRPNLNQTFSRRRSDGFYLGKLAGYNSTTRVVMTFAGEVVPEPGTTAMLALGGLGLAGLVWRRRRN